MSSVTCNCDFAASASPTFAYPGRQAAAMMQAGGHVEIVFKLQAIAHFPVALPTLSSNLMRKKQTASGNYPPSRDLWVEGSKVCQVCGSDALLLPSGPICHESAAMHFATQLQAQRQGHRDTWACPSCHLTMASNYSRINAA